MNPTQCEIPKSEEKTVSCPKMGNSTTSNLMSTSMLEDVSHFSNNDTEAEAMSFIVLGKDSLDAIQASSLASYVDIQQKSMSIDYNSMILSMATNEVHQKLEELLQENTKLKETIKQNNLAMKKQLNTMVSWQEMVVKLHEHHREKFKETTSLIGNLKQENLELKTKLVMQQTEDSEHNFEAIDMVSNFYSNNFSTHETVPQMEASALSAAKGEKYALSDDLESKLAVYQIEDIKHSFEAIDLSFPCTDNIRVCKAVAVEVSVPIEEKYTLPHNLEPKFAVQQTKDTPEIVSQVETSTLCAPEEKKHTLPDKQHVCQCSCSEDLKKEVDHYRNLYSNMYRNVHRIILEKMRENEKLLSENEERQIPCEYSISSECSNLISKESSPAINHIDKLIYSIDKCEMDPVCWNDGDYENNRMRYNDLMSKLIANFTEVMSRCRFLTHGLHNIVTIFAPIEKDIDEGMFESHFENNLKLLKEKFVKYRIEASVYNQLARPDNDMNHLILKFCGTLKNVEDHISSVFTDYRENLRMVHLMMTETLNMMDTHDNDFRDNSQEQTEVQQKLRILAIQQNKVQKEKEELEALKRQLDTLRISLINKEKSMNDVLILQDQLIRRKNLYDGKLQALLDEKRSLMQNQKINSTELLTKYKEQSMECARLQQQLDQSISEISLYKSQLSTYEEDFKQERGLKESLLQEKNKLDAEIKKQVTYNEHLKNQLSAAGIRLTQESPFTAAEIMPPCPKCQKEFATVQSLTEHIEECLNLS